MDKNLKKVIGKNDTAKIIGKKLNWGNSSQIKRFLFWISWFKSLN